ncbi:DinB family protein [Blastococcus sp. TF02A_35]|uniref:mycothiol transferase n=1 Tax=Blastococcus sp. TF02A-35 TaxID=2559612 RepID=UPI00107422BF|nr:DinB family protein [Blastococcus sp. TF02A_35]TFV51874.1 DinB family protein [Blastococcus sp. TF02A_35]
MRSSDVYLYAYDQIHEMLLSSLGGLGADDLGHRVAPDANPIGWLAWHLLRVQDDHVAELAGREQVWTAQGWAERFGLPFDPSETGYGFDREQVSAVRIPSVDLLTGYADAVHAQSAAYLRGVTDEDLDRMVDDSYDPPVTVGMRLVSVIGDDMQHLGQIGYARGLLG